ncbi:MAG: D-glycero-beta-D-manno-heptose 1-phosphate adenylyltransferase [Candidatus Omnitrophica bacterium]|nr:D-glycero-beta-D-manno-heptose 1-phosphate adenylyltransferase [Candidatus Omnitrophota bacterium]
MPFARRSRKPWDNVGTKRKGLKAVRALARRLRQKGRRIVFTNGCFDLIHPGHIQILTRAHALGDYLIVGLNSDKSVRRLKGPSRPFISQQGRSQMLEALECVDCVVIFDAPTPEALIRAIHPDVLVKGADWTKGEIAGGDFVASYGGKIARVPLVKGQSSTRLIRLLKNNVT